MRLAPPVVRQNGVDQCTRMHRIMSFRDVHADDIEKAVCSQLMAKDQNDRPTLDTVVI